MTTSIETKTDLKEALLYYLKHGVENAIKKDALARQCGVGERTLRLAIRELIDDGYPVCGTPKPPYGYYLANSPEEIAAELSLLRSYGLNLLHRYSTLRKIKASMVLLHPGQLSMRL